MDTRCKPIAKVSYNQNVLVWMRAQYPDSLGLIRKGLEKNNCSQFSWLDIILAASDSDRVRVTIIDQTHNFHNTGAV